MELARPAAIDQWQRVEIPWQAWYKDTDHTLCLPRHWTVDVLSLEERPALDELQIEKALDSPIGSRPLAELAQGCKSACIAVDDLARPTKASLVLPTILTQLQGAGIDPSEIRIVIACGSHGSLHKEHIAWKIGADTAERYQVECHDASSSTVLTGIAYGNDELAVNKTFLDADIKVGIGCALPHSFAGYSGGAKIMLPGLANLSATSRSHKFVQMGLRGGGDPNTNKFRLEAEEIARQLGFHYAVNVVPNQRRDIIGVFAGDLVESHRRACRLAEKAYSTHVDTTYDCLILNAYPKDTDLIQAENAFVALKRARAPVVCDGGVLLLTTAASDGIGHHGLFAPGGLSYRPPQRKRSLGNRELWLYAPSMSTSSVRQLYWEGYHFFDDERALAEALVQRFPGQTVAGVLPCAPMQQLADRRETTS